MNPMYGSLGGNRGAAGNNLGQNQAGSSLMGNPSGLSPMKNKIPKGYSQGSLQQFDPQQMQLYQQMFGYFGPDSFLSKLAGGDEDIFNQIEAPALRQFGQLQGDIASRFSGLGGAGSLGARKGSGFGNAINQASSDFAQDLQSKRQGLQQQALRDLISMSGELLGQRPQQNFLVQKQHQPSFMDKWLGLAGNVLDGASRGGAGGIGGF